MAVADASPLQALNVLLNYYLFCSVLFCLQTQHKNVTLAGSAREIYLPNVTKSIRTIRQRLHGRHHFSNNRCLKRPQWVDHRRIRHRRRQPAVRHPEMRPIFRWALARGRRGVSAPQPARPNHARAYYNVCKVLRVRPEIKELPLSAPPYPAQHDHHSIRTNVSHCWCSTIRIPIGPSISVASVCMATTTYVSNRRNSERLDSQPTPTAVLKSQWPSIGTIQR